MKKHAVYVVMTGLPFLMFHWMIPFVSDLAPGIDYIRYHVWPQADMMFSIHSGSFPLYVHWVNGGMPGVSIVGQAGGYLPFPYLLSLLPGYGTGYALQWNILLDFVCIAAAHIVLFRFLRKTGQNTGVAFFISMITVYSPRIQLSFFYGAALDTWVGHIFLCSAIGFYYLQPGRWKGPLLVIASACWVVCSGYPGEVYYGMLTAALFTLFLPYCMPCESGNPPFKNVLPFWIKTGAFIATAILLSFAYLLPLYVDTVKNVLFPHQSYDQICYHLDTPVGIISNFFLPLRFFYAAGFAGTPLYLAVMLTPVLFAFRLNIPKAIWLIWAAAILIGLHAMGPETPVHRLAWEHLPLAASVRAPARILMMLPMLFVLVLIWLFHEEKAAAKGSVLRRPLFLIAGCALVLTVAYITAMPETVRLDLHTMSLANLRRIPPLTEPLTIFLGLGCLAIAAVYSLLPAIRKKAVLLLCVIGCLHIVTIFRYSSLPIKPIEKNDIRTYERIASEKAETLHGFPGYLYTSGQSIYMDAVTQIENYMLEPFLGKIYRKWTSVNSRDDAYALLKKDRKSDEAVVENMPARPTAPERTEGMQAVADTVELTYSSYNRLVFCAQAALPSVFSTALAHTGYWRAWVNGRPAPVYRANGYACAVLIPAGKSTVEFRYWSGASVWGMAISCATLALIGILIGLFGIRQKKGAVTAGLVSAMALALFLLWYSSLYSGKNFNTRYTWVSPPADAPQNIAFGKPTQTWGMPLWYPYTHGSECAVDGDVSFYSCFVAPEGEAPWWEVDLKQVETIDSIVIHVSLQGEEYDKIFSYTVDNMAPVWQGGISVYWKKPVMFNRLPLTVATSTDHENWEAFLIRDMDKRFPVTLKTTHPKPVRYIRIIAAGKSRLCLNEVEVYRAGP
ncbi:MAG: hypothetical protein ACOZBW_07550 [Thermodesulfobacteriota bacterium]